MKEIPFNVPYMTGAEIEYIKDAHRRGQLAGDGFYTKLCQDWLEKKGNSSRALLTHSCTAALEMAAILIDIKPGDEVILPSFTFVSTANAFLLRGAKPVFVDIRKDTLNIDESQIESGITERTRAIVPVHYAGLACEMSRICEIAHSRGLMVVEDAAQALESSYSTMPLGYIGDIGVFSFHETKNIISGEGGAIIINNPLYIERAEIIREKGTDRKRFSKGLVDKYTWQDIGSSFLPGELIAAFLWGQILNAEAITAMRRCIWRTYHELLDSSEKEGLLTRPTLLKNCEHNAHIYYVLLPETVCRTTLMTELRKDGIHTVFHYVPLHSSPFGSKHGRNVGKLPNTTNIAARLLRLPLWVGLKTSDQEHIVEKLKIGIKKLA
jgi:dTDP-4-amino-4,6-dideoxygalactose transaminase